MRLNFHERILLVSGDPIPLLPTGGRAEMLRSLRPLREALAFSEQEIRDYKITSQEFEGPNGRSSTIWRWPMEHASVEAEISFPPIVQSLVSERLAKLEGNGNLPETYLGLWEKFVEAPAKVPAPEDEKPG